MNQLSPVSSIMTKDVITLSANDTLLNIKHIFDAKRIHHIPIINEGHLVGMVSKSDFEKICFGISYKNDTKEITDVTYSSVTVEEIMTTKLVKVSPNERIDVAALIFHENLFHALPVVEDDDTLVGIVTTFDLIHHAYKLTSTAWK
jgi:CBS domain-containing protein